MVSRKDIAEQRAADALAALGNHTRLRIFKLLIRAGREGQTLARYSASSPFRRRRSRITLRRSRKPDLSVRSGAVVKLSVLRSIKP